MPGMFSRRRGNSNPPMSPSTSSAAATAATSAFLQKSPSTTALSSSAAAAALRSHTTSPEPIANLQTKRMVRRGSVSSTGSGSVMGGAGGAGRGILPRTNSNGSMTERTFRSPSPGRANGAMSPSPRAYDIPPVPSVRRQRSSSMEPPQRITSPTPAPGKRGASVDRVKSPPPVSTHSTKRLSDVHEMEESESPNSKHSRNFSRPTPKQQNSPVVTGAAIKHTHGTGSWFTKPEAGASSSPQSRGMSSGGLPSLQAANVRQNVQSAANKPVKKHRVSSAPGSHFATANQYRGSNGSDTSDDAADTVMVYDPNSRTFVAQKRQQIKGPEPSSPVSQTNKPDLGTWDPNSRSFVPRTQPATAASVTASVGSDSEAMSTKTTKPKKLVPAIETKLEPPPKSPARYSPGSLILPQHSPTVNKGLATQAGEVSNSTKTPVGIASPAIASSRQRTASLDIPRNGSLRQRQVSLSPQRSAHFSNSLVTGATRHVPPARDMSPVKSALKQSPASSLRTNSPLANFPSSPIAPPSEASDTASDLASQDGFASVGKKKSFRVSFEAQPQSSEISAPVRPRSPLDDDEGDAIMKPRPALPSFGSVRKNRVQPEPAEKVTEMPPERHETSSDHVIGGLFASAKASQNDPLPPEVTSKESAGYVSDESSDAGDHTVSVKPSNEAIATLEAGKPKVRDFADTASLEGNVAEEVEVPAISLQPPTPGLDEETRKALGEGEEDGKFSQGNRTSMEGIVVPGRWSLDDESAGAEKSSELPSTERSASPTGVQGTDTDASQLSAINEDDSEDSAEFSDAAEDLSDLDNGGFASLNAIVESPIVTPSMTTRKSEPLIESPESPSANKATKKAEKMDQGGEPEVADGDWNSATAYWSQLTRQQREKLEREHLSSDDEARVSTVKVVKKTAVKNKKQPVVAPPAKQFTAAPKQQQNLKPGLKPALKQSMRAQPGPTPTDDGLHLRRSMRSSGTMATTLRPASSHVQGRPQSEQPDVFGGLQKKTMRPMSASGLPASSASKPMPTQRPVSLASSRPQESSLSVTQSKQQPRRQPPQVSVRLQKELAAANDSDSESSFKKRRRAGSGSTVGSQNKYSMKRSMRGGSIDETPPMPTEQRPISPTPAGRRKGSFSIRSLSPTGSLFGRNRGEKIRESLRDPPSDSGRMSSLRGPPAVSRDSGKGNKLGSKRVSKQAAVPARTGGFKSRFVDSDSEGEDDRPRRGFFRSRFADSDGEDEPGSPAIIAADLTPVRGIPRRKDQEDGDSTDLDDSDDDNPRKASRKREKQAMPLVPDPADVEKAMAAARRNLGLETHDMDNQEGEALQRGSLRLKTTEEQPSPTSRPEGTSPSLPEKKRRGFMGNILRRNRNSANIVPQIGQSSPAQALASPAVAAGSPSTIQQPQSPASPSSPSRAKLVRRNSLQAKMKREDSYLSTLSAPARVTREETPPPLPDNWPLVMQPKNAANGITSEDKVNAERPNTSDGVGEDAIRLASSMRPNVKRRSMSGTQLSNHVRILAGEEGSEPGEREAPGTTYSSRTGKKKKFGILRRAFGLND